MKPAHATEHRLYISSGWVSWTTRIKFVARSRFAQNHHGMIPSANDLSARISRWSDPDVILPRIRRSLAIRVAPDGADQEELRLWSRLSNSALHVAYWAGLNQNSLRAQACPSVVPACSCQDGNDRQKVLIDLVNRSAVGLYPKADPSQPASFSCSGD